MKKTKVTKLKNTQNEELHLVVDGPIYLATVINGVTVRKDELESSLVAHILVQYIEMAIDALVKDLDGKAKKVKKNNRTVSPVKSIEKLIRS